MRSARPFGSLVSAETVVLSKRERSFFARAHKPLYCNQKCTNNRCHFNVYGFTFLNLSMVLSMIIIDYSSQIIHILSKTRYNQRCSTVVVCEVSIFGAKS